MSRRWVFNFFAYKKMKQLITTSWKALLLLASLFVFSSASAQQPCGITVAPDSMIFESQQGAAVYKVCTVTNTSSETVTVSVYKTGEDTGAFMFEPQSFMLQPAGKKEFKVYFKPNANVQRYYAMLNFSTNAGIVCTSVVLVGTGTYTGGGDKGLFSEPGSYKFPATNLGGESCKTFTIKNTASVAATINGIGIDGDESFVIGETYALPITLQPNETLALEVCYKPEEQTDLYAVGKIILEYELGSDDRKLYIALSSGSNSGGDDHVVVIKPSQFQFPKTEIGKTTCQNFILWNRTDSAIIVNEVNYEGSAVFAVNPAPALPISLLADDSMYIQVCFTPADGASNDDWKGAISVAYTSGNNSTVKHVTATFFAAYEKPACLGAEPGDDWTEPILIGGKDDRMLVVVNKRNVDLRITGIRLAGEDVAAFTINATTPILLPALGKVEIPFTFAPYAGQLGYIKEKYIAAVVLALSADDSSSAECGEFETHVWGYGLREHDNDSTSVAISLFPSEKQTIGLSNRGIKESYTLLFVNNLDKDIVVQSISLASGAKFKIAATDPATTPFTLKPRETFTVTIEFESADGLLYKDKLIIVSDFGITASEFDLQGVNAVAASVRNALPEGVSVAALPNPMRSNMTIDLEGIRSAKIEISDVLGSPIMRAVAAGDWKWDGRMATGAPAPAGTYFVRVQGESMNGERFVTTRRVIVER